MTKIASYQLRKFWIGRQIFRVTAIATLPTYQNLSLVVMQVTIFTLTFLIVLSLHCFVGIFGNKLSMYMSRLSGWLSSKPSKLPEMPEWLPSSTPREGPWARLSGMGCVPTCPLADAVQHHRYGAYQISVLGIRIPHKMSRIPNTAYTLSRGGPRILPGGMHIVG
jgi:hypothetical protein